MSFIRELLPVPHGPVTATVIGGAVSELRTKRESASASGFRSRMSGSSHRIGASAVPAVSTFGGESWANAGVTEQAIDNLPDGPVNAKVPKLIKPPIGDYYHSIEGPKGEIGCYLVSDGTQQPWRVRVRPPCFINLQALKQMSIGHLVADVVAIIGTLDIVLGEIDR